MLSIATLDYLVINFCSCHFRHLIFLLVYVLFFQKYLPKTMYPSCLSPAYFSHHQAWTLMDLRILHDLVPLTQRTWSSLVVLVKETEPIECLHLVLCQSLHLYFCLERVYYIVLVHMAMEVENSHHLLSASWRPRKTGGVVRRPESQVADSVDPNVGLKAWGPGAL